MNRIAILCPGRGSYGRSELGFIRDNLRSGPTADALLASDNWRAQQKRPTIRELRDALLALPW